MHFIFILVLTGTYYTHMEKQQNKDIFKERASFGNKTYFFDVKESVKGTKFLVINESRKVGDKNEYSKIMLFENQLEAFTDALRKASEFLQKAVQPT
jgi:hypothetical protein